ncbi:MAG: ATP-binding cassette domain-containing protein [Alphaproteobacteria bacterium]|jgi:glycerol transport system ATP-binding protein|nr:ATP-binding cassette domain-containing protein [Alphaproteobacteria bacterium]
MARIHLDRIAHSYIAAPAAPQDYALRQLDHVWEEGGAYALLGPSGCGKTTLLNVISGLIRPTEGRVLFDEEDVTDLATQRRNIAQVFQFPVIYDTMTVAENLAFPLRNRRVPEPQIRARVGQVAEMLELSDSLNRRARGLSADAKQKISLGRGLVRDDVAAILFDEPLTVIDPHLKWHLRRQLKRIHEELAPTMVYVTHDQNEALTFADKVVVMLDGEVLQVGTPQELFETPQHTFVAFFIGSPGMNLLPCRVQGGVALIGETPVCLPPGVPGRIPPSTAPDALQLGIRPQFLELYDRQSPETIPVSIAEVEDLGNYQLVQVRLGDHGLTVKVPEDMPVPADRAHLRFPPEWTRLYADDRLVF